MSLTATDFPAASTLAVRSGIDCDTAHGAVTPPLVLSSNFSFTGLLPKNRYTDFRPATLSPESQCRTACRCCWLP